MRNYQTLDDITEEYLRDHPDEFDDYINIIFEEYAQDGDIATLLSSLRIVSRVKGVSFIEEDNPKFESVNAIMHAMGYRLVPQKL